VERKACTDFALIKLHFGHDTGVNSEHAPGGSVIKNTVRFNTVKVRVVVLVR
jgi:hypothetical protein